MKKLTITLFWTLFVAQCVFSFILFRQWNSNVLIPLMMFIGMATWLFGRERGLLFYLLTIIILSIIYEIHAEYVVYYEDKASGTGIALVIIYTVSLLKNRIDLKLLPVRIACVRRMRSAIYLEMQQPLSQTIKPSDMHK
ncbi:hypothetical protein [Pontiella agarivorans]|uniref:Uncharacterized protein n=1 Tax=Pontiella agarivorans TaxID=3038953 RepID=A0ABU5MT40_9BACT|nr:hypothetical protein [Pontiella agarivorans]MDZ8117368.1 hypothetical protein [Pontiella agarivorans]